MAERCKCVIRRCGCGMKTCLYVSVLWRDPNCRNFGHNPGLLLKEDRRADVR
jgi:hypothetical protein